MTTDRRNRCKNFSTCHNYLDTQQVQDSIPLCDYCYCNTNPQPLQNHIQRAVDNDIDPFEIVQGEILNQMLELQDNEPKCCNICYEVWEAKQDLLTNLRVLGYNISFAILDKEKLNG